MVILTSGWQKKKIQQQLEQYEEWGTKETKKKKKVKTTINNKLRNCKYCEAQGHWEWKCETQNIVSKIWEFDSKLEHISYNKQINFTKCTPIFEDEGKTKDKFVEDSWGNNKT